MALQQVSLGGASAPVAPIDLTSQQGQTGNTATSTGGLTYQQYLSDISSTPFPVVSSSTPDITGSGGGAPTDYTPPAPTPASLTGAIQPATPTVPTTPTSPDIQIDPFTGSTANTSDIGDGTTADPNGLIGSNRIPGNAYEWDPFSFGGAGEGAALTSESQSPGYQAYGQNWLNLLNTIATQNLQWGGTNDYGGELKGGGSVGPWLTQNIITPYNAGNQNDALANAIYFVSSQTGKPATDPEVQQMGGAFLDYTLQNANRYGANTSNFEQRAAENSGGLFGGVFGDVLNGVEDIVAIVEPELAPLIMLAQFAQDASQGNYLGAGLSVLPFVGDTLGDIASVPGLSDAFGLTNTTDEGLFNVAGASDAATLSDFGTAGQIASAAGQASQVGAALSQGNFIGALGPGVELGSGLVNSLPGEATGTTGTNAPESGGILSGAANSLGLTPQQLTEYLGGGISLGSSAVPLIQQLTAGGEPTLNVSAVPPVPAAAATPAPPPGTPGQPLQAQTIANPAQATYRQPGPRQANPNDLVALLASLGVAA